MELPTRSLVLRVCQFRHDRISVSYYILTVFFCQLIFIYLLKKIKNFSFYPFFFEILFRIFAKLVLKALRSVVFVL